MRFSKRLKLGLAASAALTFGAVNAAPSHAVHQTVTGLTTGNQIVQFAVGTPNTLINGTPASITFPAGATDTDLIGIDYRPRGGNLFAQAIGGTIYVLEPNTNVAGMVTATQVSNPADPFTGTPTAFGFDFNPQVDRIRTVNNEPSGTSDNNYRYNPNNGARVAIDSDLDYQTGDANDAAVPNVVGAAYTNNFDGTTSTTLYDIDSDLNILAQQGTATTPNPNLGKLATVGPLGVDTTDNVGFDIEQGTGVAYASLQPTGSTGSSFYRVNLTTGAATLTNTMSGTSGQVGGGSVVLESISLIPIPVLRFANAATSVAENSPTVSAIITVVREGPLNQTATVDFATSNGTATAGSDYISTSGTLMFAPGDASENITVTISDDGNDEANETFTVSLSAPSTSANLFAAPPNATTTVTIVDDEATPGQLEALVSVPFQTLKRVQRTNELKYSYSCDQACTESSSLQLKDGTVLSTNSSSVSGADVSNQTFSLTGSDIRQIRNQGGRKGVPLRIVSTFTDGDGNQQTITTRFRLFR